MAAMLLVLGVFVAILIRSAILSSHHASFTWLAYDRAAAANRPGFLERIKHKVLSMTKMFWAQRSRNSPRVSVSETVRYMPTNSPPPVWRSPAAVDGAGGQGWLLTAAELAKSEESLKDDFEGSEFGGGFGAPIDLAQGPSELRSGNRFVSFDYGWTRLTPHETTLRLAVRAVDGGAKPPTELAFGLQAVIPNRGALLLVVPDAQKGSNCWFFIRVSTDADGRPVK